MREGYATGNNGKELHWILIKLIPERVKSMKQYLLIIFSVKDRNLFHRVDTIGNIFTSGAATSENITDGVHEKKKKYPLYLTLRTIDPWSETTGYRLIHTR